MARSARSSAIKKNKGVLKKRVFGPVETARNDRMSAKLLALAKAPKEKMEVEQDTTEKEAEKEKAAAKDDVDMDAADKPRRSKREIQRRQIAQASRFEKKSRTRPRNQVTFPSNSRKNKSGKGGKK